MNVLKWLAAGNDTGMSSKAIAFAALGEMPPNPSYPHDGDDFGRCVRLLLLCPDAKLGLKRLEKDGGEVWKALIHRWSDIEVAWRHDMKIHEMGERDHKKYKCYDLMCSITRPIEDASRNVVRGKGFSIHVGK